MRKIQELVQYLTEAFLGYICDRIISWHLKRVDRAEDRAVNHDYN